MVTLCIRLVLSAAISFRAIPKAIHVIFSSFPVFQKIQIPSYKTVLRWVTKVGLYNLLSQKEKAKDWAFLVDNSIQLGIQKCLVVLGVRLSKLQGKPLTFEAMVRHEVA